MILAQRILDTLRAHGPIAAGEFPRWFGGIDRIDLDAEVSRLLRKNSISFALNKYDLVAQKPNGHRPFVSQVGMETPPSAAEEVAASLKPATALCIDCGPQPVNEFRRSSKGKLHKRCYRCAGLAISEAMKQHHKVNGGSGDVLGNVPSERPKLLEPNAPTLAAQLQGPEGECPQAVPAHGTTSEPVVDAPQGNAGESLPSVYGSSGAESRRTTIGDLGVIPASEMGTAGATSEQPADGKDVSVTRESVAMPTAPVMTSKLGPQSPTYSGSNAPPAAAHDTTEKRGNNRDVSAERCCDVASVPGTPESYSSSDPREDARTPAGDSIAFPRNVTPPTDEFLKRIAAKLTQLQEAREEVTAEMDDLIQLEVLYREVMGIAT
jgi:hypothetical protein